MSCIRDPVSARTSSPDIPNKRPKTFRESRPCPARRSLCCRPEAAIIHENLKGLSAFVERHNRYSDLEAAELASPAVDRKRGSFKSWLAVIMRRRIVDHRRAQHYKLHGVDMPREERLGTALEEMQGSPDAEFEN